MRRVLNVRSLSLSTAKWVRSVFGIVLLVSSSISVFSAEDVDPLVKASDYYERTVWSYHAKEPVSWNTFKPRDFGSSIIAFSGQGVRPVGKVPAPGVHPRIFFSPEDLPVLRLRIKEDRGAQEAWKNILAWSHALRLKYDEKADYAQPDWTNGSFHIRGRVPDLHRIGGYAPKRENYFAILAAGGTPEIYKNASAANFFNPGAAEAFRCLIEDDAAAGQELAKATVRAVQLEQARRSKEDKPILPGQPSKPSTSRLSACSLGFIYDFIFNFMTPEQKKVIHDELVILSSGQDNYGTFNNAEASRSNWATFSYWVFDLMAIEGEPGFNDLKFLGLYRGWRNFYTYSFFDSGAAFEGEGKLLFGLEAAVAMDRVVHKYALERLTNHPLPRQYYSKFSALAMLPTRDKFAVFDILGGMGGGFTTPHDLVVAKYLFPEDKTIDFVYRALVGDDYKTLPSSLHSLSHQALISAIFATSYTATISPESLNLAPTFFCGQRSLLMTRSSWDRNATMLTMHVRGASGGHPYPDRNGIMLSGQGRTWITIPGKNVGGWACNTVVIDGAAQSATTPARVVDFSDQPLATFMTGDAKYSWDWVWSVAGKNTQGKEITRSDVLNKNVDTGPSWKLVEQCFNDFSWAPSDREIYKRPLKLSPHWLAVDGVLSPYMRQLNMPVLQSFRTAGLVRGSFPYVLIMDDTQRDAFEADYDWNLTLPVDVMLSRKQIGTEDDIILAGKDSITPEGAIRQGEPALLIRVLACEGQRLPVELGARENVNLLTIRTRTIAPRFKILMYAFRMGDSLPISTWSDDRTGVTIAFPGQKDVVTFTSTASGKTNMVVMRDKSTLVNMSRAVPTLIDPESVEATERLRALPQRLLSLQGQKLEPVKISGFVAGWDFNKAVGDSVSPLPTSSPLAGPISLKDAKMVPGINSRQAIRVGQNPLQVALPWEQGKKLSAFSVECWVKTKSGPFMGPVLNIDGLLGSEFIQGNLRLSVARALNDSWPSSMFSSWTHLAITIDKQQICVFRNGVLMSRSPLPDVTKIAVGKKFSLGGKGAYGDAEVSVQSISFYGKALSADDIADLYVWGRYCDSRK